jgi:hypothetical protein
MVAMSLFSTFSQMTYSARLSALDPSKASSAAAAM